VAREFNVSRQQQDEYAVHSQQKTEEAQSNSKFSQEIVPVIVKDRKGDIVVDQDEYPRPGTSLSSLSKLKPAFNPVSAFMND